MERSILEKDGHHCVLIPLENTGAGSGSFPATTIEGHFVRAPSVVKNAKGVSAVPPGSLLFNKATFGVSSNVGRDADGTVGGGRTVEMALGLPPRTTSELHAASAITSGSSCSKAVDSNCTGTGVVLFGSLGRASVAPIFADQEKYSNVIGYTGINGSGGTNFNVVNATLDKAGYGYLVSGGGSALSIEEGFKGDMC